MATAGPALAPPPAPLRTRTRSSFRLPSVDHDVARWKGARPSDESSSGRAQDILGDRPIGLSGGEAGSTAVGPFCDENEVLVIVHVAASARAGERPSPPRRLGGSAVAIWIACMGRGTYRTSRRSTPQAKPEVDRTALAAQSHDTLGPKTSVEEVRGCSNGTCRPSLP